MTREELEGVVITIDDMRPTHCAWGIRGWFNSYGLDLKEFLTNGIPAQVLYDTGDPLVLAIIERKLRG